ncbi:MAG: type II toxin-antitoxin system VapC family toxin [Acidobacteria bacterium]|nr:type II toxin-antitoxin system VapC family toxin [Acidobacteriota bacterium]
MIVVDSSALIAILDNEPDAATYAKALAEADAALISAATLVETAIVMLNRHGERSVRVLDELVQEAGLEVESVTVQQALLARQAYAEYGKGRSEAGLNFGDCLSYALAKATEAPLLFKGEDFSRTDIDAAVSIE